MEELKMIFSKNLRFWLEERGKQQIDLVEYLGTSTSTVSEWCTGKKIPRANTLTAITHFLNIKMSDLVEEKKISSNQGLEDAKLLERWHRLTKEQQAAVNTTIDAFLKQN